MTVTVNGSTGVSQVQDAAIVQADLATNVTGNGPAFRAMQSIQQQVDANIADLCLFDTEVFDTNNNYNPPAARFTPTVAGYYQINAAAGNFVTGSQFGIYLNIRKNGLLYSEGGKISSGTNSFAAATISDIVYCNGTTDFIDCLVTGLASSGTLNVKGQYFSASLVRAA